jgi:hypothetical protein
MTKHEKKSKLRATQWPSLTTKQKGPEQLYQFRSLADRHVRDNLSLRQKTGKKIPSQIDATGRAATFASTWRHFHQSRRKA